MIVKVREKTLQFSSLNYQFGARRGWGTALQAGSSRVRFPMV